MDKTLVYFTCYPTAVLWVDGAFMGEGSNLPVALTNGIHYIGMQPIDFPCAPTVKRAEVLNGQLIMENVEITYWPDNICEACLFPSNNSPIMRDCIRISNGLWAVLYDGVLSIETDVGKCLMSHSIPLITDARLFSKNAIVCLHGQVGYKQYLCIVDGDINNPHVIEESFPHTVAVPASKDRIAVVVDYGDIGSGRQQIFSITDGSLGSISESKAWLNPPDATESPLQTAKQFLDCLLWDNGTQAMSLLDESLLESTTFEEIRDFFGNFSIVRNPIHYPTHHTALMLGYKEKKCVHLTPYGFSVKFSDEGWKIDNFYEL